METKAAVAFKAGDPLSIETVTLDGPLAGEVLVEMKATGVCHTDAFTLSGDDPEGAFPAILGHEGAGVVVEIETERVVECLLAESGAHAFRVPVGHPRLSTAVEQGAEAIVAPPSTRTCSPPPSFKTPSE